MASDYNATNGDLHYELYTRATCGKFFFNFTFLDELPFVKHSIVGPSGRERIPVSRGGMSYRPGCG